MARLGSIAMGGQKVHAMELTTILGQECYFLEHLNHSLYKYLQTASEEESW